MQYPFTLDTFHHFIAPCASAGAVSQLFFFTDELISFYNGKQTSAPTTPTTTSASPSASTTASTTASATDSTTTPAPAAPATAAVDRSAFTPVSYTYELVLQTFLSAGVIKPFVTLFSVLTQAPTPDEAFAKPNPNSTSTSTSASASPAAVTSIEYLKQLAATPVRERPPLSALSVAPDAAAPAPGASVSPAVQHADAALSRLVAFTRDVLQAVKAECAQSGVPFDEKQWVTTAMYNMAVRLMSRRASMRVTKYYVDLMKQKGVGRVLACGAVALSALCCLLSVASASRRLCVVLCCVVLCCVLCGRV